MSMKMGKRIGALLLVISLVLGLIPYVSAANDDHLFYERPQEKTDYAYSFAVVGDTQDHVEKDVLNGTSYTENLYKWIVDNKDQKNIQWVMGLGDITENGYYTVPGSDTAEWEMAKAGITQLDAANIPYSLVKGNHDNANQMNVYFGPGTDYAERVTGFYNTSSITNCYFNFEVAGTKYMVICLEYGPTNETLEWANRVVKENPDRRVIVTTHMYLNKDGSLADKNSSHAPNPDGTNNKNNGDMIWDKFVKKHPNIIMVLSGHLTYRNVGFSQQTGVYGNTVSQFLIDPQDDHYTEGFVCMLYFSEDGKEASAEWISTVRTQAAQAEDPTAQDVLYREENQFDFTVTELDDPRNYPMLSSLTVNETAITLEDGVLTYNMDVGATVGKVPVSAVASSAGASVTIKGADEQGNVTLGEPRTTTTLEVAVTYEQVTTTYKIDVYREPLPWADNYEPFANIAEPNAGSRDNPYQIANGKQLAFLSKVLRDSVTIDDVTYTRSMFSRKYYKLTANIELDNIPWTPIGFTTSTSFQGYFDGDNYTIYGLNYTDTTGNNTYAGLFGAADAGSTFSNVHIASATLAVNISSNGSYVGGLLGIANGNELITFTNCSFDGTMTAISGYNKWVAGLVSRINSNVSFTNCSVTGTIKDNGQKGNYGGIFATLLTDKEATLTNCYSAMNMDCTHHGGWGSCGGFLGTSDGIVTLENCHFAGTMATQNPYPIARYAPKTPTYTNVYYKTDCTTGTIAGAGVTDADANENKAIGESGDNFANGIVMALLNTPNDTTDDDVWMQGPEYPIFAHKMPALSELIVNGNVITLTDGVVKYSTADVADTVDKVKVVATADAKDATVTVNGIDANGNVALGIAGTTTEVTITVADKLFSTTYTVNVYRKPTPWDGTMEPFANYYDENGNAKDFKDFIGTDAEPYIVENAKQLAFLAHIVNLAELNVCTETSTTNYFVNLGSVKGYANTLRYTLNFDGDSDGEVETYTFGGFNYSGWKPTLFREATIVLAADIDLNNRPWTAIGQSYSYRTTFCATFEGNNHTISNLNYTHTGGDRTSGGLFGYAYPGTVIRNVHVKSATITHSPSASNIFVGGIVGYVDGNVTLTNCSFDGNIDSDNDSRNKHFGGMVGYINGTGVTITDCRSSGTLSFVQTHAGGIVGTLNSGKAATLTNCYSTMEFSTTKDTKFNNFTSCGGLVGNSGGTITLTNCHFAGKVPELFPFPIGHRFTATTTYSNIYYREDWCSTAGAEELGVGIVGSDANATETNCAQKKSAVAFADGTVTKALGAAWATSTAGYPVLSELGAVCADALNNEGAAIRTSGVQGIRFKFGIKYTAQTHELLEYGVLIAKMSTANKKGNGQLFLEEQTSYALQAPAYTKSGEKVTLATDTESGKDLFAVVLHNFATKAKYETEYIARAYALYEDSLGQEIVVYSEIYGDEDYEYNSVYEVADYLDKNPDELGDDVDTVFLGKVLAACAEQ